MQITSDQLEKATDTVETLLTEIGLTNYLFDVEPREERWEVSIECAVEDGWESFHLGVSEEYLVRGKDDAILHDLLLNEWRDVLKECKKK